MALWWFFLSAMLVALLFTGLLRRYALARSLIDLPNERSSHSVPTPRGGGVAIVLVFLLALPLLGAWLGWQYLIAIILISSVVGSIIGITLIVTKVLGRDVPTPFGPYLALGGIICLLWGPEVKSILGAF